MKTPWYSRIRTMQAQRSEYLMEVDGMDYDEAVEFIEYNTIRALPYAGDMRPIIKYDLE